MGWVYDIRDEKTLEIIEIENNLLKEVHPALKIVCLTHDDFTGDLIAITTFFPQKLSKDLPQKLKDEGWFQTDIIKNSRTKILFFSKKV